jgi:hypothetical protein
VYSRILENGSTLAERKRLLDEYEGSPLVDESFADPVEHADILREAVCNRNGWKTILARCSATSRRAPRKSSPVVRGELQGGDADDHK